eukprot:m.62444 g.62444  ORF g.62444 m.62444 type:complete len:913 (+) comp7137_c2_seq4:3-2741(+)
MSHGAAFSSMGTFHQFRLLLWKNYTLHKRRPWATVFEILLPILFMVILVSIRQTDLSDDVQRCSNSSTPGCSWPAYPPSRVVDTSTCPDGYYLYYTGPGSDTIIPLINPAIVKTVSRTACATQDEMVTLIAARRSEEDACKVGVVFTQAADNTYHYVLRFSSTPGGESKNSKTVKFWNTQFSFPFFPQPGPRGDNDIGNFSTAFLGNSPNYAQNGFLAMQQGINAAIAEQAGHPELAETLFSLLMQRFPQPPYTDDPFINAIKFGMPMLLMLSFLFTAINIVRSIVLEKERRLKESMKMMGLKNWVHWAAWWTDFTIFLGVSVLIMTVLLKGGTVLPNSDGTVVFFFLFVYALASISFCFFLSALFSRASTGAAAGGILWFMAYMPYLFIGPRYDTMGMGAKQGVCILSTTCMSMGANIISTMEAQGAGVQWANISEPPSIDDNFAFGNVIGMLFFDIFFYSLLTWYIEGVFPGDYGVPRPWYFPFQPSYWCTPRARPLDSDDIPLLGGAESEEDHVHVDSAAFEREPEGLHAGISVRGLRKVFGTKVAVQNTWLNMYEGQVTALLGHNGAGKTTTFRMLTGDAPMSYGRIAIDGYDVEREMTKVRRRIGYCPQYNGLIDLMTGFETLCYFARLRGVREDQVHDLAARLIKEFDLSKICNKPSGTYSGGNKRKLSTAIALVGDPPVVFLDEPTTGMDPGSKRMMWIALSKVLERGQSIVLTSHSMEECEALCTRLAIMVNGQFQCIGSIQHLKSRFGRGYQLKIKTDPRGRLPELKAFVASSFAHCNLKEEYNGELTYQIEQEEHGWSYLFAKCEEAKSHFDIKDYSISQTSLEQVFLTFAAHQNSEENPGHPTGPASQPPAAQPAQRHFVPTPHVHPQADPYLRSGQPQQQVDPWTQPQSREYSRVVLTKL